MNVVPRGRRRRPGRRQEGAVSMISKLAKRLTHEFEFGPEGFQADMYARDSSMESCTVHVAIELAWTRHTPALLAAGSMTPSRAGWSSKSARSETSWRMRLARICSAVRRSDSCAERPPVPCRVGSAGLRAERSRRSSVPGRVTG